MKQERVGFAFCGSFCTHQKVLREYLRLTEEYETVVPIVSEAAAATDTRFGTAQAFLAAVEQAAGREAIRTIRAAEPSARGSFWIFWLSPPARATRWQSLPAASPIPW